MHLALAAMALLETQRWTPEQAREWGQKQRWSAGCNFIPSTAINQLEMWQEATFDPKTIDREFGLMQKTGMSVARIFLHDLVYEQDPQALKRRMQKVLSLANGHKVKVLFVFFDDCWNPHPKLGPQPEPKPGVHNSGWVKSPSLDQRQWPQDLPRLKTYVQDVLKTFRNDNRIWMWDLYNEPNGENEGKNSLPLLTQEFEWAREIRPSQPLTAGAYSGGQNAVDKACTELSDVTSFHCYDPLPGLEKQIAYYQSLGRPVVCTEWMARTNHSLVATHLPIFKQAGVTCIQWGLVSGKTNTIFPWGSPEGAKEPKIWFHDLYRKDGVPFDPAEVALYRELTAR